jgi:hypothetical protein
MHLFHSSENRRDTHSRPKHQHLLEKNRSGPLTVNGASMFSYTPLTPFLDPEEFQSPKRVLDR